MQIHIEFMVEKKDGFGEDSEPLSFCRNAMYAVGVFDGMGGSGAPKGAVRDTDEEHSQAYFASRMAKEAVQHLLEDEQNEITAETLKEAIMQQFNEKIIGHKTTSMLRSNLLRPYPTTMALIVVENKTETNYVIKSFWAGDSRNYLWTDKGFYQISIDDLRTKKDPYENLKNDDVLSNCITASGRFDIHKLHVIEQKAPFIVISATDGCFGYLKAPMYFERIIKDTLTEANDVEDWRIRIIEEIQSVAADDISLALRAVGFDNFNDLREKCGEYDGAQFKVVDDAFEELSNAEQKLNDASKSYEDKLTSYWQKYKGSYMKYISEEENGQVTHISDKTEDKKENTTMSENGADTGKES